MIVPANDLRITLDVNALEPHLGGIGRYTWELSRRLPRHDGIASVDYFARGRRLADPDVLLTGAPLPPRPRFFRSWRERREHQRLQGGLFHGPNYFLPDWVSRGVITIHDLSVFRFPETHPAERVMAFEKEFLSSLNRAVHVLTDTETVRAELIEDFGVDPAIVSAVHLGVDPVFRPRSGDELAGPLARLSLEPGTYGLCVSTLEPRKKILELIEAWRMLPVAIRTKHPLVLAGGKGWRNEELQRRVDAGVAEGWLRHLGFVDESDLPALYAGAALFLYPSSYEGFGLPPLEAMASGVPVIVSNRSCLPEVCGDAARYIDPDDIDTFSAQVAASLGDPAWRQEATGRGLLRASRFTWDRCIDSTVDAYRTAAAAP
ncbi:glycosyltransferase family 1 protein [Sphingomonas humi]|uniref:Glycosyltransferase family 1 protein n=1 Tax=Sphingomonas humi TaxID=335630 RepID=A0ABP7S2L0_9SPHN